MMNKYKTEIKWGLIFTGVSLLWMVLERMLGWHSTHIDKHATYTNFFAIVAIAIFVVALIDKRNNDYEGSMTWLQGFISGTIIGLIVAILSPLAQWITHAFITPDYFSNAIEYAVSSGNSTQEQAEQFFNLSSYMIQSAIGGLVMGAITAAIVAIFVKKQ